MPNFDVIILAAGRSTRMGERHKLLEVIDGQPMVWHALAAAHASLARAIIVVTGHRAAEVVAALGSAPSIVVHNAAFATGLAGSLLTGIAALPPASDGALIQLGDMPRVTASTLNALIAAARPLGARALCVPVHDGRRGNPVLIGSAWFQELARIDGDSGARAIIADNPQQVIEVATNSDEIFLDIDTPAALELVRGQRS